MVQALQIRASPPRLSSIRRPRAPTSESELTSPFLEQLTVYPVEDRVVLLELPGEGPVAEDHLPVISEAERPRMLLRRSVPGDVVEVVVGGGVLVVLRVADKGLEVALRGGDEVGIIKEEGPRQVFPASDAVLGERPG